MLKSALRTASKLPAALTTTMEHQSLIHANAAQAAAQIAYFRAIPWCAAHLSSPNLTIDQSVARALKPNALDTLISRTLNTAAAIPAYVTFYRTPAAPPRTGGGEAGDGEKEEDLIREVKALIALGPMVNGWEGVCHGGMVVTLLDEVMGQVFAANKVCGLMVDVPVMTGYLNTRFERPVRTGTDVQAAVVLVSARMVRREGRKYWLEAEVCGEDGGVMARGRRVLSC